MIREKGSEERRKLAKGLTKKIVRVSSRTYKGESPAVGLIIVDESFPFNDTNLPRTSYNAIEEQNIKTNSL